MYLLQYLTRRIQTLSVISLCVSALPHLFATRKKILLPLCTELGVDIFRPIVPVDLLPCSYPRRYLSGCQSERCPRVQTPRVSRPETMSLGRSSTV